MLWLLNSRAALGAQCWGSVCFPWGGRGLQQDTLIHEELSASSGLYSTRERCLGLVIKIDSEIEAKGQGGLGVCVGEGEAGSSRAVVSVGAGLLTVVPSVPTGQADPRGIGVGFAQGFLFTWPGRASLALKLCEMWRCFLRGTSGPCAWWCIAGAKVPGSSRLEFSLPEAFPNINQFKCTGTLKRAESLISWAFPHMLMCVWGGRGGSTAADGQEERGQLRF